MRASTNVAVPIRRPPRSCGWFCAKSSFSSGIGRPLQDFLHPSLRDINTTVGTTILADSSASRFGLDYSVGFAPAPSNRSRLFRQFGQACSVPSFAANTRTYCSVTCALQFAHSGIVSRPLFVRVDASPLVLDAAAFSDLIGEPWDDDATATPDPPRTFRGCFRHATFIMRCTH